MNRMSDDELWDSLPSAGMGNSKESQQKLWQPIMGYKHNPKRVQPFPLDIDENWRNEQWQAQP